MSTLNVSNITDGTDTVETGYVLNGSAKAWVNFNGTGTIATRDSFNVSGLTDNGTSDYTNSFTSAMSNGDYIEVDGSVYTGTTRGTCLNGSNYSSLSTSFRVMHVITDDNAGGAQTGDPQFIKRGFLGDLA